MRTNRQTDATSGFVSKGLAGKRRLCENSRRFGGLISKACHTDDRRRRRPDHSHSMAWSTKRAEDWMRPPLEKVPFPDHSHSRMLSTKRTEDPCILEGTDWMGPPLEKGEAEQPARLERTNELSGGTGFGWLAAVVSSPASSFHSRLKARANE